MMKRQSHQCSSVPSLSAKPGRRSIYGVSLCSVQMLRQGFDVDTCDYDGRTGLMLACAHGNLEIVHSLLAAGAEPSLKDNLGGSALLEACKGGHDNLVKVLRDAGAECASSPSVPLG